MSKRSIEARGTLDRISCNKQCTLDNFAIRLRNTK